MLQTAHGNICCSVNNRMCGDRFRSKHADIILAMDGGGFTTRSGPHTVLDAMRDPAAGRILIFSPPLPPTYPPIQGARCRNKSNPAHCLERSVGLFGGFGALSQHELIICAACAFGGGDIAGGWPDND